MLTDYFNGATETVIILPKKNGKSTLLAALAVFHLVTTPDAECVIAAASREQADRVLRPARGFVRRSAQLAERMRVKQREIVSRADDGYIRILAADKDTADGVTPTLAIVDELHRQKSAELYGVFRDGLGPRDGRMVTISTAGDREISPLGEMRRAAKGLPGFRRVEAHSYVSSPDASFVLHEWALTRKDKVDDMKVVKSANPAPWQTEEALRKRHDSVSTTKAQWARFACGLWVSEEGSAVVPEEWDDLAEKRLKPKEGKRYGFLDLGWKIDTTGVGVISFESNKRRAILGPRALQPPVDEGDVVDAILDLQQDLEPDAWVYDPNAGACRCPRLPSCSCSSRSSPHSSARSASTSATSTTSSAARSAPRSGRRRSARASARSTRTG
jgi:phage terminase large subunit-like protein